MYDYTYTDVDMVSSLLGGFFAIFGIVMLIGVIVGYYY